MFPDLVQSSLKSRLINIQTLIYIYNSIFSVIITLWKSVTVNEMEIRQKSMIKDKHSRHCDIITSVVMSIT